MVQININGSEMGAEINRKVCKDGSRLSRDGTEMVQRSNSEMIQKCSKYGSKMVHRWFTDVLKMV